MIYKFFCVVSKRILSSSFITLIYFKAKPEKFHTIYIQQKHKKTEKKKLKVDLN